MSSSIGILMLWSRYNRGNLQYLCCCQCYCYLYYFRGRCRNYFGHNSNFCMDSHRVGICYDQEISPFHPHISGNTIWVQRKMFLGGYHLYLKQLIFGNMGYTQQDHQQPIFLHKYNDYKVDQLQFYRLLQSHFSIQIKDEATHIYQFIAKYMCFSTVSFCQGNLEYKCYCRCRIFSCKEYRFRNFGGCKLGIEGSSRGTES